jgi:hypothetical protein
MDTIAETPSLAESWEDRAQDERDAIIGALESCDREQDRDSLISEMTYSGPGKFEGNSDRALCVALYEMVMQGFTDESAGSVEYGLAGDRIGRFILWHDSQGFVTCERFDSEGIAASALADATADQYIDED